MTTDTSTAGTVPVATTTTAEKKTRVYSTQNKKAAEIITSALQQIAPALEDAEILTLLTARGYNDAELRVGLELQASAQSAFDARQKTPGSRDEAKKLRDEVFAKSLDDFGDYRKTVQAMRKLTVVDKTTLGASGTLTKDLQKFVTTATAAYQAAQKPPYAEPLASRSYTITWLNNAIAALKTVTDYDNTYTGAKALAKDSTEARDVAVDALTDWICEFRTNAKLALKGKPVLLAKLSL